MKKLSIVAILFFAFTITLNAQDVKYAKIKTSAQSELCKTTIQDYLAYEKGVKDVELDLTTKIVTVKYSSKKTNEDNLCTAITKLGYDANGHKANKVAYDKLPTKCKPVQKSSCGSSSPSCGHSCGGSK